MGLLTHSECRVSAARRRVPGSWGESDRRDALTSVFAGPGQADLLVNGGASLLTMWVSCTSRVLSVWTVADPDTEGHGRWIMSSYWKHPTPSKSLTTFSM